MNNHKSEVTFNGTKYRYAYKRFETWFIRIDDKESSYDDIQERRELEKVANKLFG